MLLYTVIDLTSQAVLAHRRQLVQRKSCITNCKKGKARCSREDHTHRIDDKEQLSPVETVGIQSFYRQHVKHEKDRKVEVFEDRANAGNFESTVCVILVLLFVSESICIPIVIK